MAKSVQLPDGSWFPLREGEDPHNALAEAAKLYPDAFGITKKEQKPTENTKGFKAAAAAGFERIKGEAALTAGKLGLMDEAAAEQYNKEREAAAEKRFTPTEEGWTEAPWQKLKETAGGSVPYMVAPAAAGLAAAFAPVSAPVAAGLGAAGAFGVNAAQFVGSNLARQMDTGKTLGQTDLGAAALAAIPQAAVDTAAMALVPGVGKLFGSVGSKLTVEEAKAIASQTLGKTIADYAAHTGATMGREGLSEAVQQVFERLQAGLSLTDEEARKEYIDNFIGGAALGGAAAPVGRAYERSGARAQVRKAEEEAAAKAAADEEAAKNTPEALRQLESDYGAAYAQVQDLNKQVNAAKPGKGATDEQKAAYDELKKQRAAFVNETFKPLKQEYDKRKDSITKMYEAQQTAAEVEAAPTQQAAVKEVPSGVYPLDVSRLMDEQEQLRNQLSQIETQLSQAAPEQFDALNQQRQDLQRRMDARATLIEERGGTPTARAEFEQETAAKMQAIDSRIEKLNANYTSALENKDYDAAAKAKDELLKAKQERVDLTNKTAQQMQALQEQQTRAQQRGQTLDMFAEAPAPKTTAVDEQLRQQQLEEEKAREAYGKPLSPEAAAQKARVDEAQAKANLAPKTPMPEQIAESGIKKTQLAALETAKADVATAQTALEEAVKTKDTGNIYAVMDKLNQAKNAESRAQESLGKKPTIGNEPYILDIFSPANIIRTAINSGDTKILNDIARHADEKALKASLDEKATERETLINVLDSRLDRPGMKRERVDLFSQWYNEKQQAMFKNGTYPDRELQQLYDKGGPQAIEYARIQEQMNELAKKVTTKQGNAKKSLYEQLVDLAAQHDALTAQMESGVAAPTMGEKVAAVQAKLGKGEAPAPRQMDASERYQLQRKIDAVVNKYRLVEGQVKPIRDQIIKLRESMFKFTPLEKPSVVAKKKAAEADIEARKPKVMSRQAKTAKRLESGNVRKEAEASAQMRKLATDLGMQDAKYDKFGKGLLKRLKALEEKYGKNDPAVTAFRIKMTEDLEAKAIEIGKTTPEYKATLKEQIAYFTETFAQSKQTTPTKRTTQVTRKQSSAPKQFRTASEESRVKSERAHEAYRAYRGSLQNFKDALDSEKTGREDERFLRGVETESVALDSTTISLLQQNDVRNALVRVSVDKRVDDFSRAVAKVLSTFLDATNVKLYDDLRDGNGKAVLGAATSELIELNRDGGLSVETLLHEATHAAAERVVQLAKTNLDALTKEQRVAIQELKALHAVVKADPKITSVNAKSSLSEFVAEVMSNRNLQKQLGQRKWRLSDAWQGFKSVIMRMLGLNKVETMFGASAVAVEQLFVPSSKRNLGGGKETRVTRSLSAKDIAALHDGSNSMKQFADQFGPLIKQKDRTPEDAERIGLQQVVDMRDNPEKYIAIPTGDTLDYKGMTIMSDGKPYDENNPLHYVEAEPATHAAIEALKDERLRNREAEEIKKQRIEDFESLLDYIANGYNDYTVIEAALVLKAASKWAVLSDASGRLKLAEIGKDNRHSIAVVGKETADAVIEQLREGKSLKQAFLNGLQKNADDNAKANERKNGWKKFDQAHEDYSPSLYTDEEINEAADKAGYTDEAIEAVGWDEETLIAHLVEAGYLPERGNTDLETVAAELNAGCAGTSWCTGAGVQTARGQISQGDFYVYYKNGKPDVAVRMNGSDEIGEIRGNTPSQALTAEQRSIAEAFLRSSNFKRADKYIEEFNNRELLKKILSNPDFADYKALVAVGDIVRYGEISPYFVRDILRFHLTRGYGSMRPSDDVSKALTKRFETIVGKAFAENNFIGTELSFGEGDKTQEVVFANKKFVADLSTIESAQQITFKTNTAYTYTVPKLKSVGKLWLTTTTVDAPNLTNVDSVTFFTSSYDTTTLTASPDATINRAEVYSGAGNVTVNGVKTIGEFEEPDSDMNVYLPNVQFMKVHAMDGATLYRKAVSKLNDYLRDAIRDADEEAGYGVLRESYSSLPFAQKNAFKKAVADVAAVFGKRNFNIIDEDFFEESTSLKTLFSQFMESAASDYTRSEMFDFGKKANEQLKLDKYDALLEKPGSITAPSRIADAPHGQEYTEEPEQRRFAPAAVGVQGDEKKGYVFLRKKPETKSVIGRELGIVDKLLGNFMGLAGRVQLIDQYAATEAAIKEGLSKGAISSLEATNANYLLRFGQQRSQFAGQFLTNGPVRVEHTKKDGGVETMYRSVKGTSMMDVATALNKAKIGSDIEQENWFTLYVAGQRANQVGWEKLNIKNPAEARAEYNDVLTRLKGNKQAEDAFKEAAKLYQQYNAGLMDFLVETGALSAKKAAELKSISYVPFYRINANGEVQLMIDKEHPIRISNIKDQPQLKELVGGNEAILPIFTSATQNTFMITGMGLRNQAVKETAFVLTKMGIASRIGKGMGPTGTSTVRFFKNGEQYHAVIDTDTYGIPAELIVRGMEGITTTLPALVKAMAIPANILRSFVVRNPAYAVRQVIRDPLNAWLTTGTDATPVLSSMKELASMVAGRSEAERKLMETGAISSNIYSGDAQDMSRFLKDLSVGRPMWEKVLGKFDAFALQGDAATRAVIYKDSLAKGMSEQEALLRTLESMNFSRRGVSPSMQWLSVMIPFFNAQIQGLDVIYRAMKGDMPFSKQLEIREKMVKRGLLLAAGTLAYAAFMGDDEAYKRAKPEERYGNWFVYVPGVDEPVRVPIPFEMGFLFKALPEAVWNAAMQDEKAGQVLKGVGKLAAQSNPFSMPAAIKPATEAYLGKSFFGGDIESQREKQQMLPTERYRESTTEIAKMIGAVTGDYGVSPIMVDHLIRGYTAGLGIALVQLANPILASDSAVEKPTRPISKTPFIGGLFQPIEGRGTLDEAYDRMEEIRQTKGTFNKLVEDGKRAEAKAFAQQYANRMALMSTSGAVQKQLGEWAKMERIIRAHPTMTTAEKDARLKQLDKAKIAMARKFMSVQD